jgi:AcrR family transcriptional regulator
MATQSAAPRRRPEGARERILSAASRLFYERGIRNVGIDEIIATAGVAKASLYKHFASKDALIVEVLHEQDEAWRKHLEAGVAARGGTPKERLLAVFDVLEEWFGEVSFRGCAFINTTVELASPGHPGHAASREHKRRMRSYLRELAKAAKVKDADALAGHLALLAEGAIVTALMEQSAEPARRARSAAAQLLAGR